MTVEHEPGYRSYTTWQDVPLSVHTKLHLPTQQLRPYFETHLLGKEVTQTLLAALQFFWRVCPDLVNRDVREVSGSGSRCARKREWSIDYIPRNRPITPPHWSGCWPGNRRRFRVICGITGGPVTDVDTVFGLTFRERCSFTPFFETVHRSTGM